MQSSLVQVGGGGAGREKLHEHAAPARGVHCHRHMHLSFGGMIRREKRRIKRAGSQNNSQKQQAKTTQARTVSTDATKARIAPGLCSSTLLNLFASSARSDILVAPEEIQRIPLPLDVYEPAVIIAVCGVQPVTRFLFRQEVDVRAPGGEAAQLAPR